MSIDPKFIELTDDVFGSFFSKYKVPLREVPRAEHPLWRFG